MKQSREPEYQVSEKTSQQWALGRISSQSYKAQVQEKSRELYLQLSMAISILEKIRDFSRELEQLREATE